MPMVFPTSPVVGQVFSSGGRSWVWNGSTWDSPRTDNPPLAVPTGNVIINGAFDIWQRGTSFTNVGNAYTADRWANTLNPASNLTNTRVTGPTPDIQYAMRLQVTASVSSAVEIAARQQIERQNVQQLAGQTITLSFWYRSNRVGTHGARIIGSANNVGGTDISTAFEVTTANTWQRYVITNSALAGVTSWTGTPEAVGTYVDIGFRVGSTVGFTSLSANDYFELSGVQLEASTVATPFRRNAPNIGAELSACHRYFQAFGGDYPYQKFGYGLTHSTSAGSVLINLHQKMRTIPSFSFTPAVASFQVDISNVVGVSPTSMVQSVGASSSDMAYIDLAWGANGNFGGHKVISLYPNNSSANRLYFSAEL